MRFPSIKDVSRALRNVENRYSRNELGMNDSPEDPSIDVRLQVYPGGDWDIHTGDASYDQDHSGYWGCSSIPAEGRRFDSKSIARDLLEQAKDDRAFRGEDEE